MRLSDVLMREVGALLALSFCFFVAGAFVGSRDGTVPWWRGVALILAGGALFASAGLHLFGWL